MGIFQKIFGPDPETEKVVAFEEIERQFSGDDVNKAKAGWLTMRGNNYGTHNNFDKAIADFNEALQFEPNRPSTLVSLGGSYNHKKMWKDGISTLEKAKEFLPRIESDAMRTMEEHILHYELGNAYFFLDDKQNAVINLSLSLKATTAIGVYKDCGDVSEKEWASIRPTKKNAELLLSQIHSEQERGTVSIMQEPVEISPLEYVGFEEFFTKYYKDTSTTEQNKYILSIFPNIFWKKIGVSFEDVLKHADIFFQSDNTEFIKAVAKSKDSWLLKYGALVYSAMNTVTIWNKELMKNENFRNKCADITLAELQVIGIKMCALLPKNEQKKFLDKCTEYYPPSIEPDFAFLALRVWADFVCTPLAEKNGLVPTQKESFPRIHLFDVIKEVGFIATIAFLRELLGYRNFDKYVQKFSYFLLDVQGLKNYTAFDSMFFPYIGQLKKL